MEAVLWTQEQEEYRQACRAFADEHLRQQASSFDREQNLPRTVLAAMAGCGYLGALVGREYGGQDLELVKFGFLNEEIGSACSSCRNAITVHSMVCQACAKWGKDSLKERWLPRLASGQSIGAFALSEPNIGSDARMIGTEATLDKDGWLLNGRKKWVTLGQLASVFLVLAKCAGSSGNTQTVALLVGADTPGITITPLRDMLGSRASMLAEISFDNCRVPNECMLSKPGFGLAVCSSALEIGRLSVAWGAVGLAQACLEASVKYANSRVQFGSPIANHQLVQQMIASIMVGTRAARLMCLQASASLGRPGAIADVLAAKYYASGVAMQAASQAVQIHGANGCSSQYPVERHLRDAKVLEIIEGTNQIMETLLAQQVRLDVRRQ